MLGEHEEAWLSSETGLRSLDVGSGGGIRPLKPVLVLVSVGIFLSGEGIDNPCCGLLFPGPSRETQRVGLLFPEKGLWESTQ